MSWETRMRRLTVRFTQREVERIDAALARYRTGTSRWTSRVDRSEFIRAAVLRALEVGCPREGGRSGAFSGEADAGVRSDGSSSGMSDKPQDLGRRT